MPVRPLAAVTVLAASLAGQDGLLQEPWSSSAPSLAAAIADLGQPSRAEAAARLLIGRGRVAVAPLVVVVTAPQRYVEPPARVMAAMYVLGELGAEAQPALPALEHALGDPEPAIARQALWAVGDIGYAADAAVREALAAAIGQRPLLARSFAGGVATARLRLGGAPDLAALQARLQSPNAGEVVAACRWLQLHAASAAPADRPRAEWADAIHARLRQSLEPKELPWEQGELQAAARYLAATWLRLGEADGDRFVGRGLLMHHEAALRRRGCLLLAHAADAPLAIRAELLPLLYDRDPELRQQAAATFRQWGRAGLLALPALHQLAQADNDLGTRLLCTSACTELLAAGRDQVALLTPVEKCLGDPQAASLGLPADPAALLLLGELLRGAEFVDAAVLRRLLPEVPSGTAPPVLAQAVLRCCANVDPKIRAVAASWLARHGPRAGIGDADRSLTAAALLVGGDDGNLVEALAWLRAGPTQSDADLRAMWRHVCPRVVVRAVAEWVGRGARAADEDGAMLLSLLAPGSWEGLLPGTEPGQAFSLGVDCAPFVRAIAATGLLALGYGDVDLLLLAGLAPAGTADGEAWLRQRLAARDFVALANAVEAHMRDELAVSPEVTAR